MLRPESITIDWLKKHHKLIHYFGLGFIQVKIDETHRLHFYSRELPPIIGEEDVHDHRYDFTSRILKGRLHQSIFALAPGEDFILEEESCKKGVEATSRPEPTGLRLLLETVHTAGTSYSISHETLHRVSVAGECVTLLERGPIMKDLAHVVRPVAAEKVCPFSKDIPKERLWEIVSAMLPLF